MLTWEPEKVKLPPDCNCVVNHILTDKVSPWLTRTMLESTRPTYNTAEGILLVIDTMEVNFIELGAKYRGWAIGIGGPLRGCFLRKI